MTGEIFREIFPYRVTIWSEFLPIVLVTSTRNDYIIAVVQPIHQRQLIMLSHSVNLWLKSRHVPRRTRTYLLVRRNFHLLVIALTAFGATSALLNDFWLILSVSIIISIPVVFFWGAYNLNLSAEELTHPHYIKGWNATKKILKPVALLLRRIPSWALIVTLWLLVSGGLGSSTIYKIATSFVVQSWFYYLIVLFFSSWIIHDKYSSEWFLVLSVGSITVYGLAVWNSDLPYKFNLILSNGSALLLLGSIVHFLLKLILQDRARASVAEEVTKKLSSNVSYLVPFEQPIFDGELITSLNEIARDIASKLVYDHVYIVLYDKRKQLLYLKGANNAISNSWKKHPWSLNDKSITAWVTLNKEEHLCQDTNDCDFYYEPEGIKCASEAAVPILVEGECVGVLDVESPYLGAFDEADISLLWQVANAMAAALTHRRQINREIEKVYQLFQKLADSLASSENFFSTLDLIVSETKRAFGADLVILYPHAVDTQFPLPHLAWAGESYDPEYLSKSLTPANRVLALLQQRKLNEPDYYSQYADQDTVLLGPNRGAYTAEEQAVYGRQFRFVKREKIKSTAFISLGVGNNVVGSLFLNYREHNSFSQDYRQRLKGLGSFLSLALLLKRQVERLSGPLAGVAPISHSKAAAAFESFRRAIERGEDLQKTIEQFKQFKDDWANAVLIEGENLRTKTISESLSRLKSKVRDLYPEVTYEDELYQLVDQLPIELQNMIYGLVSEAVANALFHGEATEICLTVDLKVKEENSQLVISIQNNGELMNDTELLLLNKLVDHPLKAYSRRSGIRALLIDARNWFGANWNFECRDSKTIFTAVIPLLELTTEE